jgi:oligoribonuclease
MDAWNKGTHGRSGLIDKVKASTVERSQRRAAGARLPRQVRAQGSGSPMCGNTIGQDRRFLVKYMPKLEAYFHYRNLDVSTLKELAKRWKPPRCTTPSRSSRCTPRWPTCTSPSTNWRITASTFLR